MLNYLNNKKIVQMSKLYSVFTGTGSYVPTKQITNDYFHTYEFF